MRKNDATAQPNKELKELSNEEYKELLLDIWKGGYHATEEENDSIRKYEEFQAEMERHEKFLEKMEIWD